MIISHLSNFLSNDDADEERILDEIALSSSSSRHSSAPSRVIVTSDLGTNTFLPPNSKPMTSPSGTLSIQKELPAAMPLSAIAVQDSSL